MGESARLDRACKVERLVVDEGGREGGREGQVRKRRGSEESSVSLSTAGLIASLLRGGAHSGI